MSFFAGLGEEGIRKRGDLLSSRKKKPNNFELKWQIAFVQQKPNRRNSLSQSRSERLNAKTVVIRKYCRTYDVGLYDKKSYD